MSDENLYGVTGYDIDNISFIHPDVIEIAFKNGYDVNKLITDFLGMDQTFLMNTCTHFDCYTFKRIHLALEYGADINKQRSTGDTALNYACGNGKKEVVQFLLDHGADIYIEGYKGMNVIDDTYQLIYNKWYRGCKYQKIPGCSIDEEKKCNICEWKEVLMLLQNHDKKIKSLFHLMLDYTDIINKKQRFQ